MESGRPHNRYQCRSGCRAKPGNGGRELTRARRETRDGARAEYDGEPGWNGRPSGVQALAPSGHAVVAAAVVAPLMTTKEEVRRQELELAVTVAVAAQR